MKPSYTILLGRSVQHPLEFSNFVTGVVSGRLRIHSLLPPSDAWTKQGSFPPAGSVVLAFLGTITPSDSLPAGRPFASRFIGPRASRLSPGPGRVSPVPHSAFLACRSPYAGGFLGAAFQALCAFHGLRLHGTGSAPSCPLAGCFLTTLQDSLDVTACQFASPTWGRCHGASALGFLLTLAVSYGAAWSLPRPDLHRLAEAKLTWARSV